MRCGISVSLRLKGQQWRDTLIILLDQKCSENILQEEGLQLGGQLVYVKSTSVIVWWMNDTVKVDFGLNTNTLDFGCLPVQVTA